MKPFPNRTSSRVGGGRIAIARTFPPVPLRTAHESFDLKQLSSELCRDLAPQRYWRCMSLWHDRQTTGVLRRRAAMSRPHGPFLSTLVR
jgi:hypothetical protein